MGIMSDIGGFAANPFGLGNAGSGAVNYLAESLGLSNADQVAQGQAGIDQLLQQAAAAGNTNRSLYGDYLQRMQGIYGDGASRYSDAVQKLADAIGEAPASFSYTGDVNDFYDKFAGQAIQASLNAMRNLGGQNIYSSDFMKKYSNEAQALASSQWEKAYDRMMQDRQQQLQEWNAGQTQKQNYLSNLGTLANAYGNDRNQIAGAIGDYISSVASQNNADLQTRADLTMGRTNLGMQQKTGAGALLGGVGNVLGGIFGA